MSPYGPTRTSRPVPSRYDPYALPAEEAAPLDGLDGVADGEVCQFFAKSGWCKFGDQCRFAHAGEPKGQEVCQFFARSGWCKWADKCRHLHVGEAREPPPGAMEEDDLFQQLLQEQSMEMEGPPQGGSEQRSGEVCQFFARAGWCKWADQCKYAHSGLVSSPPPTPRMAMMSRAPVPPSRGGGHLPKVQGEVCAFFQKAGWCKWADQCKHIHALPTAGSGGFGASVHPAGAGGHSERPPPMKWGSLAQSMPTQEPCEFFAKAGWCKWGDACKYAHTGAAAGGARPPPSGVHQPPTLLTGSTSVCKFFVSPSGCRNGEMCQFQHVGAGGQQEACQFFQRSGWCKWADQCKYLHAGGAPPVSPHMPGMRPSPAPPRNAAPMALPDVSSSSLELCQFFTKAGWCKWADGCRFLHVQAEPGDATVGVSPRPASILTPDGQEVCQFFARSGWCKFADSCRYAHAALGAVPAAPGVEGDLGGFAP